MRGGQGEPATAPAQLARSLACSLLLCLELQRLPEPDSAPPTSSLRPALPRPLLLAASPVTSYCKCDLLKRSRTPTEGSNLQAAVVSVA